MDSRDWQFIAPVIANKSYKAITLDVRGAGKSPVPSEPINYVEDLKKLLDHLDIHEAVLVGQSLGGMIATDFTLMYPNRVSQLIWIASWPLRISIFRPEHAALEQKAASMLPDVEKMIDITLSEPSWSISSDLRMNYCAK